MSASKSDLSFADRIAVAVAPTDAVARAAERRWGVARLPGLVSSETLVAWREGWRVYSRAIAETDADVVERVAPKIARAIVAMEAEAEAAGHEHASTEAFEAPLADGRVLVVVRSHADASAVLARSDGRERVVWAMEELAAVLPTLEITYQAKVAFPGARVSPAVVRPEGFAHDWAAEPDMLALYDVP